MATGITVTHQVRNENGSLIVDTGGDSFTADQTNALYSAGVQVIGFAAHELVAIGSDIASAGIAYFKNLDDTNFVELGRDVTGTFVPFARLEPGESYPIRLATTAVYAKADTAAVSLQFLVNAA